jgi:two-component system phosphate regulon response regulator PhoB/two-component system alkaline phosphatase synthesis response regulator PhoP
MRIEITTTEFKILALLLSRIGWVFSRHQILEVIDPEDKGILDRTVDVHIKNLREKLIDAGKHIRNIRGIGYKFEE